MEHDYQLILNEILREVEALKGQGEPAEYIPELAKVDPSKFGASLKTTDGSTYTIGDSEERFSIQSISKVLSLVLIASLKGEGVLGRVGVEPSGDPFNSLAQLEYEHGIPRNPLINSGALVIADMLISSLSNPKEDFLAFIREISGCANIDFDVKVAHSEKLTGFRNAAMANLLKSFGNIENDIEEVLDFYFHQCSLSMSCTELAKTFEFLSNGGITIHGKQVISSSQSKRINALMQTCGFYDEAGEFSFKVGLPGKSGVGGGIIAVHPKEYSIAVWSPRLNKKGNSLIGMKTLELLTTKTGFSIF